MGRNIDRAKLVAVADALDDDDIRTLIRKMDEHHRNTGCDFSIEMKIEVLVAASEPKEEKREIPRSFMRPRFSDN